MASNAKSHLEGRTGATPCSRRKWRRSKRSISKEFEYVESVDRPSEGDSTGWKPVLHRRSRGFMRFCWRLRKRLKRCCHNSKRSSFIFRTCLLLSPMHLLTASSQEDSPSVHLTPIGGAPTNNQIKQATNLRKHLLESFSQYDAIAKRIKSLRTPGPGSSQEKVQSAISNRATLFLQRNLFPLQVRNSPRLS